MQNAAEWFKNLPEPKARPGFDAWMVKVNAIIVKRTGLSADDLPDYLYDDDYEDGASPSQAASAAIRYAKEF